MNKFFMVYVEGGSSPAYQHENIIKAENEAQRLAKTTGKKAFVLCTVKSYVASSAFLMEDCRPIADELPF